VKASAGVLAGPPCGDVPDGTRSTLGGSTLLYFEAVRADPDAEIDHEAYGASR
jgi:hypothetical protein